MFVLTEQIVPHSGMQTLCPHLRTQQCDASHPLPRNGHQSRCNSLDDTPTVHLVHQRIIKRQDRLKAAGSPLTTRPTRKLSVDSTRFMTFRHDYMQAAKIRGVISNVDVRSATTHVGRDRYTTALSRLRHDLSFSRTLLGVQQLERYARLGKVTGGGLGCGHGSRSEQDWCPTSVETLNDIDDDTPFRIPARHNPRPMQEKAPRTMYGNLRNSQPIDAPQLPGNLACSAGHPRKASVSSKETLICHSRECGPSSRRAPPRSAQQCVVPVAASISQAGGHGRGVCSGGCRDARGGKRGRDRTHRDCAGR